MEENMTGNRDQSNRYCIIHGHFYQPPRENPWTGIIETQPSAHPAHDWNERIYDECYRPNAYSRLLEGDGYIKGIVNNYKYMSFNFGPTLFQWLETRHPKIAGRIIEADHESRTRYNGHGNAMAQVYNHLIMPLASRRDQLTQIRWAKTFFERRFGRPSEGIWLAETAINMETVRCLIEEGIRFVVLSPNQALSTRPLDSDEKLVSKSEHELDTRIPYRVYPYSQSGEREAGFLDVFFFDEPLSRAVSFEEILTSSKTLGHRLTTPLDEAPEIPQATIIATDGETFGHHRAFGDMCLAYFFSNVAAKMHVRPVNFAYFLSICPPRTEVRLANEHSEGTAWSCAHGTGRWIRNCGCQTGGPDHWNQEWRTPLRHALDFLSSVLGQTYEERLWLYLKDPWRLRDRYEAMEDKKSTKELNGILYELGGKPAEEETALEILRLLEAQRFMLYSYTSCGWFFSDISGIETIQNLRYAARALQLGLDYSARTAVLEAFFLHLSKAVSNIGQKTGRMLFEEYVAPDMRHLEIAAFASAVHHVLYPDRELEEYLQGFTVALVHLGRAKMDSSNVECFATDVRSRNAVENGCFAIAIRVDETRAMVGYCVPLSRVDEDCANWDPASWPERRDCVTLSPSDLFYEARLSFSRTLAEDTERRTLESMQALLDEHKPWIDRLVEFNGSLPKHLESPVSFILTNRWNHAISKLEHRGLEAEVVQELTDIQRTRDKLAVAIDTWKSERLLEMVLHDEFNLFSENLSLQSADRISYLLNIVDTFSLQISKHWLEDAFYGILTGPIRALYEKYRDEKETSGDTKPLLLRLLVFARRLNFSTSEFPIS